MTRLLISTDRPHAFRALLGSALVTGLLVAGHSAASPVFGAASYNAVKTFTDGNPGTTMTLAWDGTNYYTSSGGFLGSPYAKYDAAGNLIGSQAPSPGIDFRSVFTNGSNDLLARGFNSNTIYKQTAFGSFTTFLTLTGGTLDDQSAVVLDGSGTMYIARNGSTVSEWDLSGTFIASVNLIGLSGSENNYPQGRGIAAIGSYWLTYDSQTLSAWDPVTGTRLDTTTLNGAGTSFDSNFSYSYADGKFWVVDQAGGTWRGYDVGLGNGGVAVPEPVSLALFGMGLLGMGVCRRRQA